MFSLILLRTLLRKSNAVCLKNQYASDMSFFLKINLTQPRNILPILNKIYYYTIFNETRRNFHQTLKKSSYQQHFTENNHGHETMRSIPKYTTSLSQPLNLFKSPILSEGEFKNLLSKNWRLESATEIVKAFQKACSFSKTNNISVSNHQFNNLVDGVMDKCQDLTDDELSELLACIREYPMPESIQSHNFHDLWSALDDVCCWRYMKWPVDKLLIFADHWYLLGLCKYSDFIIQCLKRLARKYNQLSAQQLVQSLFLVNVCRKQYSMFDFECQLEKYICDLTTDELGIVSMSFFKTRTQIKSTFLLTQMLEKVLKETSTINEITLCAILKVIRYSPHLPLVDQLQELLTKLVPEIDRLSILCCVHIALAGTNSQLFHPEILTKISEKFLIDISVARLKDLERLTFALTLFNFNPKTSTCIFDAVLNELQNSARKAEIEKHPRCFSCCVHFLSLREIYPYDLISHVLDADFLKKAYGDNKLKIGREILFLDSTIHVNCPDYKGNQLDDTMRHKLSKWSVHWIPRRNQKQRLSAADKMMLDIMETIEIIHGGNAYVHTDYLLPHFQTADIVICKDKNGNPMKIDHLKKYTLGNIMWMEDDNTWYAIIVASWNSYIRNTREPTGILATKMRQLRKIGFIPVMVPWHDFANLTQQQKEEYLRNKIS